MSNHRRLGSEDGWVLVPVIILMVVAIGVGTALLTIVDTQTRQSGKQRKVDSAQTLAEGAVSATANVLAVDHSASTWPVSGGCLAVSGDLTNPSTQPSTSLAAKVTTEVQARFSGTSPDYAASAARNTTWRVDVCPVQSSDTSRWDETYLTRTTAAPASAPAPISVWVRGQASVSGSTAAARPENARAVVSKVKQSSTSFTPPANFAVGTGVFSTDIGTTLNSTLAGTPVLGNIVSPLIAATSSNIGIRCGLLTTLNNPNTTCLAGALAAVAGVTNATGLGTLNTILGLDRTKALGTWTVAPDDAIESWREEAKSSGVYSPVSTPVPGFGNEITKNVSGGSGSGFDCFLGTPTSGQVIFIEQVGNGEQYCNVPAGKTAKILIVERGAVRIQGAFKGVVYMLNKQECGSDGTCGASERETAVTREVVRIDGPNGKVTGSVWADGAGGAVGIYPSLSSPSSASLLGVGDPTTGICGIGVVGSLVTTLDATLAGLSSLVSGLLSTEEVRYWDGTADGSVTSPGGCAQLKAQLGVKSSNELLDLYAGGKTQNVVTTIHRTRANILSAWGPWVTKTTSTVNFPTLLTSTLPSVLSQVTGLLGAGSYTAIQYDGVVADARATLTQGAAPVVGTYRNVASIAPAA
ncbi:hypothetical protein BH20ACT16_BH20ACT16_04890 [soil metagenome]